MGANSRISWTDDTFNPWIGCEAISPGCAHCYAAACDHRWGKNRFGVGARRELTSEANWRKPIQWNKEAAKAGKPRFVFTGSMCDVFDEAVPDSWRVSLFIVIGSTPHLNWLVLTKRAAKMFQFVSNMCAARGSLDNAWFGVTVENQEQATARIPYLVQTPARKRFVSVEPMLGPVNLEGVQFFNGAHELNVLTGSECVDWVICGGESGTGARRFELGWARSLRAQCKRNGTKFFMKQFGNNAFDELNCRVVPAPGLGKRDKPDEWPVDLQVQERPRKRVVNHNNRRQVVGVECYECPDQPKMKPVKGKALK